MSATLTRAFFSEGSDCTSPTPRIFLCPGTATGRQKPDTVRRILRHPIAKRRPVGSSHRHRRRHSALDGLHGLVLADPARDCAPITRRSSNGPVVACCLTLLLEPL